MRRDLWNIVALVAGVLAIAILGPWMVRELRSLPDSRALAARSGERIVTLEVAGMTCAGCAAKLEEEISTLAGVSAVKVRVGQDRAFVVCARSVEDSLLLGAVRRAGPGFSARIASQ
jgi:copper chaperone CopZ